MPNIKRLEFLLSAPAGKNENEIVATWIQRLAANIRKIQPILHILKKLIKSLEWSCTGR